MNKPIIFFYFLLISVAITACCQPKENSISLKVNSYKSVDDTLYLPFDTAKVLGLYNIKTKVDQLEKFRFEKDSELNSELDTIELSYHNFACDCPRWYDEVLAPKEPTSEMSPSYAYYLEPASGELELTDLIRQCTVRLIGRHYKAKGFPKNVEFMDPNPPAGNVFRYYSYEMLSPTIIWGPYLHTGEREIPSDPEERIDNTILIIK